MQKTFEIFSTVPSEPGEEKWQEKSVQREEEPTEGLNILYIGAAKSMSSFRVMWTRKREARLTVSCCYRTQEGSLPGEVRSKRLSPNQNQTSSKDNCVVRRQHALHTHLPQRVIPNTRVLPERQPLGLWHRGHQWLSSIVQMAVTTKKPQRGKLRKRQEYLSPLHLALLMWKRNYKEEEDNDEEPQE